MYRYYGKIVTSVKAWFYIFIFSLDCSRSRYSPNVLTVEVEYDIGAKCNDMLRAYRGRRKETISSRGGGRGWKCNRSRESSKSKVISSVPLFLYLLSPFYGSPRSFFLPDRDSGQVHCLCSLHCISFSLSHFTFSSSPCSGPVLSLPLSLRLLLSLTLSLSWHTAQSPLSLMQENVTPSAAISFVTAALCQSRRVIMSVSMAPISQWEKDYEHFRRARAVRWTEFPSPRWAKVDTSSRVSQAPRSMLYGCSPVLDELLSVVNMNDAQYECMAGGQEGERYRLTSWTSQRFIGNRWQLIIWSLGKFLCFFFWGGTRTRSCEI